MFLINAPVVAVALVGTRALLPRSRADVPRAIDGRGSLMWSGALALLLFAVIEAPVRGWTWVTR